MNTDNQLHRIDNQINTLERQLGLLKAKRASIEHKDEEARNAPNIFKYIKENDYTYNGACITELTNNEWKAMYNKSDKNNKYIVQSYKECCEYRNTNKKKKLLMQNLALIDSLKHEAGLESDALINEQDIDILNVCSKPNLAEHILRLFHIYKAVQTTDSFNEVIFKKAFHTYIGVVNETNNDVQPLTWELLKSILNNFLAHLLDPNRCTSDFIELKGVPANPLIYLTSHSDRRKLQHSSIVKIISTSLLERIARYIEVIHISPLNEDILFDKERGSVIFVTKDIPGVPGYQILTCDRFMSLEHYLKIITHII